MEMKDWRPHFSRRPHITRGEIAMMLFALAVFFITAALKG